MTADQSPGGMFGLVDTMNRLSETLLHATAPSGGRFVVNKDNVLAAAKIIDTQAESLRRTVDSASDGLQVAPPGEDEVSVRVAEAWNNRLVFDLDSYRGRIGEYITGLESLVEQLANTAKSYGHSEESITAALGRGARA
ncbi:PE domain-containing protein [Actinokineospora auranticolor]|uniref:PE family protein n=1 Tax=Actinokineospora auranticolor TaxID=155976 RepID=A0A2S6GRL5_9PSEU|nr:PE domain-containing protein [Actinokineospora auranticolor]PPK67888.1 PE family protein [Actinokineospora auranticolor]